MRQTRTGLLQVALGRISPETVIRNMRLVNVYTGEILSGLEVAVWRGRIAYVGRRTPLIGPETELIDGQGMYLLPGFIDAHGHADIVVNPLALAAHILPTGTTGMLTDTHDIIITVGARGLEIMLTTTENLPFRYYFAVPAGFPPMPEFEEPEYFSYDAVDAMLSHKRVLSVGEVTSWARLLEPDEEFIAKLSLACDVHGKRIEGHMSGCSVEKINALTACGHSSCHESITAAEALERLRLGLYVLLRHGSVRKDMEPLARLVTDNPWLDTGRVMMTPDWLNPCELAQHGYLNHLVAKAVEYGIPPVKAIQMVTINPATYLGLEREIGGIAPGRLADMLLVEDIGNPMPEWVMVGGRKVAERGRLLIETGQFPRIPLEEWRPGRIPRLPVTPEDFQIRASGPSLEVTGMAMINNSITKPVSKVLPVVDGRVDISGEPDLIKASIWSPGKKGWQTAILAGYGARVCGMASSMGHETHCPMVFGIDDEDMAMAANRMFELGGGVVIVHQGEVKGELPLVSGGNLSPLGVAELADLWGRLTGYLKDMGCPWDDPLFAASYICFTGLPYVRLTSSGVVDVLKKKILFSNL